MTQLARFRYAGYDRLGVVDGDDYIDVTVAYAMALAVDGVIDAHRRAQAELPPDGLAFFQNGDVSLGALRLAVEYARGLEDPDSRSAGVRMSRNDCKVLVPIANPPKIVCVARNYGKHAEEAGLQLTEVPILFPRFAVTQIAHGDAIIVPPESDEVDWEGELAVVIGKGGRRIPKDAAFDHVAGYTVFNDVTVRDYQFRVNQYTAGKNFHASGPIGPHISLIDEGLDPHKLRITTTVNGVIKQDANTEEFIFDIPTLIEHISEFVELEAGDIIPTGTPAGVGFKRNPPEFLRHGDVIDVTIEGIGSLTNPVRDEFD